jgi:lysophospholipase L1-like esterase
MRFDEFNLILEAGGSTIYTVGDSHAEGIANYGGAGWKSLAIRGTASVYPANTTSPNPKHVEAIKSIPKGSTVVICLGCNDAANAALAKSKGSPTLTPQQVASNIKVIVDLAVSQGLKVIFVVYPVSTKPGPYGSPYSQKCRDAIKSGVTGIPVIDMGNADTYDGVHASAGPYKQVAEKVSSIGQFQTAPAAAPSVTNDARKKAFQDIAAGTDSLSRKQSGVKVAGAKPVTVKRSGGGNRTGVAVNPNTLKSYLATKGLDKNQVAGIMANVEAESSFDIGVSGDGGTSGGLFQHHDSPQDPRFTKMIKAAGGPNKWRTNWRSQVDFALSEPAGQQYRSLSFSSPEQASKWWTINFEIPDDKVNVANARSKEARKYAS